MFAAGKSAKAATPAATDPYFNQTVLLLNDTGTNGAQNNTFLDSSTNNFTITRNGNATQGSVNPYEPTGYWSGNFDGSTQYLTVPDNAVLNMGTSDFTLESWIYVTSVPSGSYYPNNTTPYEGAYILNKDGKNSVTWPQYSMFVDVNMKVCAGFIAAPNSGAGGPTALVRSSTTISLNTWYHVAFTRVGVNGTLWLNGVSNGTTTSIPSNLTTANGALYIAYEDRGSPIQTKNLFPGYLSNMRIVKGSAVYTSTFTPSTTPLTAISGTSLLTLQNNRFIDNSSNNFTITVTGTPPVTGFNQFAPTASYSGATYGGTMYLDGNGDYLQTPTNSALAANSTNYTVQAWVYADMATFTVFDYSRAVGSDYLTNSYSRWVIWILNSGNLAFTEQDSLGANDVTITDTVAFPLRQWVHVMAVKSGTTMYLFKNGTLVNTATSSVRTNFGGRVNVGQATIDAGYRGYFLGYISNFSFLVGTALYTSSFTPPTAPVSAITNTKLLLNATNAGIYDATALNDMETVGSTQVSTAQYKWSPSSMKFNGTTDYLTYPPSNYYAFGTGDFTIEGWVYLGSTNCGIFQIYSSYLPGTVSGLSFEIANLYGGWSLNYGATSQIISTTAGSLSTWYHFAVVRSSGVIKAYVNGTSIISATDTTNYTYTYLLVGGYYSTSYLLNGYLDDFRITKGIARYTSNFTPPTAAFPTR
jgi:hypothetical protein